MPELRDAFPDLEAIYQAVPPVACDACGQCCVTPHITVVEFAYLLDRALRENRQDEMVAWLAAPLASKVGESGNFVCKVQGNDQRCTLHDARALSCRVEGHPALEKMSGRAEAVCANLAKTGDAVSPEQIDGWIQSVFELSAPYHEVSAEPWFLNAANLDCWWAIALDPAITQPFFLEIREQLRKQFDLEPFAQHYTDQTGLAQKLSLIETFFTESSNNRAEKALKAIRRVIHDFPRTGSYYQYEGKQYFQFVKNVLKVKSGKQPGNN